VSSGLNVSYGARSNCRPRSWRRAGERFVCPESAEAAQGVVYRRGGGLYQCSACRVQTSPIAGRSFAATKLEAARLVQAPSTTDPDPNRGSPSNPSSVGGWA